MYTFVYWLRRNSSDGHTRNAPQSGYSPGDTWSSTLAKTTDSRNSCSPGAEAGVPKVYTGTWEGYEKAGPLLLSTDHEGTTDDGKSVRVFYSDLDQTSG